MHHLDTKGVAGPGAHGSCLPYGREFERAVSGLNLTDPQTPVTGDVDTMTLSVPNYDDNQIPLSDGSNSYKRRDQCRPCMAAMLCEPQMCAPPAAEHTNPADPDLVGSRGAPYILTNLPSNSLGNSPQLDITHYNFTKCYQDQDP
jgi:hypothetical protein